MSAQSNNMDILMYGSGLLSGTNIPRVGPRAVEEGVLEEEQVYEIVGADSEDLEDVAADFFGQESLSESEVAGLAMLGASRKEMNEPYVDVDGDTPVTSLKKWRSALSDVGVEDASEEEINGFASTMYGLFSSQKPGMDASRPMSRKAWQLIQEETGIETELVHTDGVRAFALSPKTKPGLQTGIFQVSDEHAHIDDADGEAIISDTKPFAPYVEPSPDDPVSKNYLATAIKGVENQSEDDATCSYVLSDLLENTVVPNLEGEALEEFGYHAKATEHLAYMDGSPEFEASLEHAKAEVGDLLLENSIPLAKADGVDTERLEKQHDLDLNLEGKPDGGLVALKYSGLTDWMVDEIGASENEVKDTYWLDPNQYTVLG